MKSMKKSMFVTTILMVVLLIVALSTATFAWYTSQTTVTVNETTVVSATASAASLAIDVSPNYSSTNTSVNIAMGTNNGPMIPKTAPTAVTAVVSPTGNPHELGYYEKSGNAYTLSSDTEVNGEKTYYTGSTYAAFIANFYQAPIDVNDRFTQNGASVAPTTIDSINSNGSNKTIYVINTSGTQSANINVNVTIKSTGYTALTVQPNDWATNYTSYYTDTNGTAVTGGSAPNFGEGTYYVANDKIAGDLRVAIFCDDGYIGTWATTAGAAVATYGTITQNTTYSSINTGFTTFATAQSFKTGLAARSAATCKIVAWFDGPGLITDEAGMPAIFSVSFDMV